MKNFKIDVNQVGDIRAVFITDGIRFSRIRYFLNEDSEGLGIFKEKINRIIANNSTNTINIYQIIEQLFLT